MSQSPGHRRWPQHRIEESRSTQRIRVEIGGQLIADSRDVVRVDEDQQPVRYYFPRADVRMERLEPSRTESECPFKGLARYFDVDLGGHRFADAAWSYEAPYDEHLALKDRIAFDDDRVRDIRIYPES